ncbi:MAG: tetratricopeptide repeat protein, partial [Verrucomicrobiaceae bacterium]|nr:tetratricopeptide repeat protein [Verrucomicrobiaceae bacterium]
MAASSASPDAQDPNRLPSEATSHAAPADRHIGPYRLCELIGEGGFGDVWRAEQTEVVQREVALKIIKTGMDSAQVLARFHLERQALATLEHPNIATLLDAGVSTAGKPWFAMELVRGGPVTQWCEAHEATILQRLGLFVQICRAVQHAHEKGILHRDLKPNNILMAESADKPMPKVIDFGVAMALDVSSLDRLNRLTQGDQVIGTPLYMSPEQLEGRQELDVRSDVYALGVLLYELLTGLLPFHTTSQGAAGIEVVKQLILETVPERPSTRVRRKTTAQGSTAVRPRALVAAMCADLDWITLCALEKDRARRYASVAELAADVERHLAGERVLARPPSVSYAAGRWFRRHRTLCIAAAAGSVITGAALGPAMMARRAQSGLPGPVRAASDGFFTNSLGMKFVSLPGNDAFICIHETRRQDYATYAE